MADDAVKLKKSIYKRRNQLIAERATWIEKWRELSDFLTPGTGRFFNEKQNRGDKSRSKQLDSSALLALRVFAAGMQNGMTSPSRVWANLTTFTPELDEMQSTRKWLSDFQRMIFMVLARSNFYTSMHQFYWELGAYGTAVCLTTPDYDDIIHCDTLTAGEYCIATNYKGRVDTVYREFQMTVAQLVAEFGIDSVSDNTRQQYKEGNLDAWRTVIHAIEPRPLHERGRERGNRGMDWRSVYIEANAGDTETDGVLRESGYPFFPAMVARWSLSGGDIYGTSPGMEALGDIKEMMHSKKRKLQMLDWQTNPPLQGTGIKGFEPNLKPGAYNGLNGAEIKPIFQPNLDPSFVIQNQQEIRSIIQQAFYVQAFLMIENRVDKTMTATEVEALKQEKMLQLGASIERLSSEALSPFIEIVSNFMEQAGVVPAAPEEIQGMPINIEFVSILAQAQKAMSTGAIRSMVEYITAFAQLQMMGAQGASVVDNLNGDKFATEVNDLLGSPPDLLLDAKEVQMIREARAQAAQQQQRLAAMQQMAAAAKDAGSVDMSRENLLNEGAVQ